MPRTQLPRRPPASRSGDVRGPSMTRRFHSRSLDVDWRFRDLSIGQRRLATRRCACAKTFRLEHGRRCRRTAPTERTGLRSRFARQEWRAWFEAHGTAEPPTSPRSLHRIGTRLRCFVRAQYSQKTGGREYAVEDVASCGRVVMFEPSFTKLALQPRLFSGQRRSTSEPSRVKAIGLCLLAWGIEQGAGSLQEHSVIYSWRLALCPLLWTFLSIDTVSPFSLWW